MIGTPITLRNGQVRPLRPGDILILVQRRSAIFHDLIRALKQAGLPVAGADRLRLGGELAVRDIRAVLSVLATPEDDLSLAAALRSPLFGLTEDELYRLAAPRSGLLIEALRASRHDHARAVLAEEAVDLAGTDVEVDSTESAHTGERLHDPGHLEQRTSVLHGSSNVEAACDGCHCRASTYGG